MANGIHIRPDAELEAKLVLMAQAVGASDSWMVEVIVRDWLGGDLEDQSRIEARAAALIARTGIPAMRRRRR
jgi:hypothetical protein